MPVPVKSESWFEKLTSSISDGISHAVHAVTNPINAWTDKHVTKPIDNLVMNHFVYPALNLIKNIVEIVSPKSIVSHHNEIHSKEIHVKEIPHKETKYPNPWDILKTGIKKQISETFSIDGLKKSFGLFSSRGDSKNDTPSTENHAVKNSDAGKERPLNNVVLDGLIPSFLSEGKQVDNYVFMPHPSPVNKDVEPHKK
jgi:hypothetical protein